MRAVVLRDGELEVRETADPVPGPGELLIRPLSAAICASDVHYMDHPNSAPRFVWDSGRDTIMGHEFIGEVVGHGPDCSGDFPIGTRVTSLPIMIRHGEEPLVIGHDPDAPGRIRRADAGLGGDVADGARRRPERLPSRWWTHSRWGSSTFAVPASSRASCRWSSARAPSACRRWRRWPRAASARSWCPTTATNGSRTPRSSAPTILVNPSDARPIRGVARDIQGQQHSDAAGHLRMRRRNGPACSSIVDSCEFMARVYAAGGWYDAGTIDCTDATHKGMTIQFGGGPHPQDWYGTLDAVAEGRLDPSPSIGKVIGLDEVPEAIDQVRKVPGAAARRRASDRIMSVLARPDPPDRLRRHRSRPGDGGWVELGVGPWLRHAGAADAARSTAVNPAKPRCRWHCPTAASCRSS